MNLKTQTLVDIFNSVIAKYEGDPKLGRPKLFVAAGMAV